MEKLINNYNRSDEENTNLDLDAIDHTPQGRIGDSPQRRGRGALDVATRMSRVLSPPPSNKKRDLRQPPGGSNQRRRFDTSKTAPIPAMHTTQGSASPSRQTTDLSEDIITERAPMFDVRGLYPMSPTLPSSPAESQAQVGAYQNKNRGYI
ncbi:hypothetical protein HK405_001490 [Cladochytrium tenue]|nr:hypothetical protein HK405_001490 [Cladochytrium tenue]